MTNRFSNRFGGNLTRRHGVHAKFVAPVAEEILFRGVLLGSLLGRGISPLLAGGLSIIAFGAIHISLLGVVALGIA